jgi:uroporphyrinogen-III synthase
MNTPKGLEGLKVVLFESRLSDTMADLVTLQGGEPIQAPSMKEVPLENNPDAFLFGEKLFRGEIDTAIFLTGVGTKALMQVLETRYAKEKILEALRKIPVVVRGPKPTRVLRELHVPIAVAAPEPNTWKELLAALDAAPEKAPIKGKVVALQEYGVPNENLLDGLKARGAHVFRVPIYRWALPDNIEPLMEGIRAIVNQKAQVSIFTTAVQIQHVMQVAEEMGETEKLKSAFKKILVASVGPDCTEALKSFGIIPDVEPHIPKMGPLVLETSAHARRILESKR